MGDRDLAAKYNAKLAGKGVTDRKWIVTAGGALILVPAGRHHSEHEDETEPKERLL
ncbi:hypothetical protein [Sphingopyxis indica]|uniref:Uncharacterized protein n=1 Tax=Sphingopyxis indica TaxID=436663 RepID=A0A239KQL4_9SPHN|nr:hypothetical protein [Sphingopyxis indica]SNT19839.1 hypothetical protein SAMN06295955_11578 [Sphingopyxis indica]